MYGYFLQQHIANYDGRNINDTYILLDILLCSIAEYFYELFLILVREIKLTDQGQQQTNLSKGPFTQAIFVAATQCNFCRAKVASSFEHVRNPCDIAATNRTENRTWFRRAILKLQLGATKIALNCSDKNRPCKQALTGPLEYKYRVIFVLILGVICTLWGAVG